MTSRWQAGHGRGSQAVKAWIDSSSGKLRLFSFFLPSFAVFYSHSLAFAEGRSIYYWRDFDCGKDLLSFSTCQLLVSFQGIYWFYDRNQSWSIHKKAFFIQTHRSWSVRTLLSSLFFSLNMFPLTGRLILRSFPVMNTNTICITNHEILPYPDLQSLLTGKVLLCGQPC